MTEPVTRRELRRRERRRRASPAVIVGELLITAGVLVFLFLGWRLWLNNLVTANQQTSAATEQAEAFAKTPKPVPTDATATDPPIPASAGEAEPFAVIYIPRLGADWKRVIRESVDVDKVLNSYDAGVGHYPMTQLPGERGNFAIAGHDSGWGNTFIGLSKLQIGDAIYIQTAEGWYTYRFRNFQFVQPEATGVLFPVPGHPSMPATDRLITITTCNPPFAAAERLIAHGTFETWSAPADVPEAIASVVALKG